MEKRREEIKKALERASAEQLMLIWMFIRNIMGEDH